MRACNYDETLNMKSKHRGRFKKKKESGDFKEKAAIIYPEKGKV